MTFNFENALTSFLVLAVMALVGMVVYAVASLMLAHVYASIAGALMVAFIIGGIS